MKRDLFIRAERHIYTVERKTTKENRETSSKERKEKNRKTKRKRKKKRKKDMSSYNAI
jgi:hypothetical protein